MKKIIFVAGLATIVAQPLAAGSAEDVIIEPDVIKAAAPQSSGNGTGLVVAMTLLMLAAMAQ